MLTLSPSRRLYVCLEPADMRKSVDGLAAVALAQAGNEVLEGHLFLFRNRRGDRLKVLFWDRNGFCILYKRLERGRFSFPQSGPGRIVIDETTFQFLLGGLSLERKWNQSKKIENADIF